MTSRGSRGAAAGLADALPLRPRSPVSGPSRRLSRLTLRLLGLAALLSPSAAAAVAPSPASPAGPVARPLAGPVVSPAAAAPTTAAEGKEGAGGKAAKKAAKKPLLLRIDVRVTAVSGGNAYLDKGREAGVHPGDKVLLYPPGSAAVESIVRSVSKNSARIPLPPGAAVDVDDTGEILVPRVRKEEQDAEEAAEQEAEATTAQGLTDHPDWTAPPEDWDESQPLLAPAFDRTHEEKPTRLRGRVFFLGQNTWNDEGGESEFTNARLGTEVFVENPFEEGGEFHFDGELYLRRTSIGDSSDQSTRGRVDRLSYSWGGDREEGRFFEAGRFLQNEFPEFGVLDGLEVGTRLDGGGRLGASVGYMPEPFPRMESGEDLQVAVFYRTDTGDPTDVVLGIAYQNTWHKGEQDRNLIVTTLDWNPDDQLSVFGSAWIDYYDSGDDIKDEGFELTNFRLNGVYRLEPGTGFGAHVSHIKWPELLRNEIDSPTAEQILDNEVTRAGLSAWHELDEHLRLDGRLDRWEDEDDTGGSGDVRLSMRDLLYDRGEVSVAVFRTKGSFSDSKGLRLSANRSFGEGTFAVLSWETAEHDNDTNIGSEELDQQTIRASIDMLLGATRNLSIFGERRTGDEQDSKNLGVFFQQRF